MTHRTQHLTTEQLLRYAETGRLPNARRGHLERCVRCQGAVAAYEQIVRGMRSGSTPRPGPDAIRRLIDISGTARPKISLPVIERTLEPDTKGSPELSLRGGSGVTEFRFEGAEVEVELTLTAGDRGPRLVGQALGPDGSVPPVTAWIEKDGVNVIEVPVGEHGEFAFDHVPEKPFDVMLDLCEERLRLRPRLKR